MSWLLDGRGLEILYKTQVRSSLEYACLAWGGAANKHLAFLDKVQARAVRIIKDNNAGQEPHLTTLQHQRDVAGLTVVFKVQVKRVSHLQALWQPYHLALVTTRAIALATGKLKCKRVTIHKNLFASFIINNTMWLVWYKCVVEDTDVLFNNSGRIMKWFILLGWGAPAFLITLYAIFRGMSEAHNNHCWITEGPYNYILNGPVVVSLLLNLFFLVNIVRVLVTKLRAVNTAPDTHSTRKVRFVLAD
ncbi:Calcitonin gene-related peptide type 1 receptor [Chionoecetes opilio]|uniref:Calcitonin gene-related peptide type 1 receptor n=1 Tax=Chionoecetes opilio TaxID=41210 RepID=A0A8J4YPF1_CHIOP|nr:Calcitonin gene-related peptide type 1 receptor [Chionoecetes opilio]